MVPLCVSLLPQVIKSRGWGPLSQHPYAGSSEAHVVSRSDELPVPSYCWSLYVFSPSSHLLLAPARTSLHPAPVSHFLMCRGSCLKRMFSSDSNVETSPWGPKLSQRFSPRPSQRCRVLLNTHLANWEREWFQIHNHPPTSSSAFMRSLKFPVDWWHQTNTSTVHNSNI